MKKLCLPGAEQVFLQLYGKSKYKYKYFPKKAAEL